MLCYEMNQFLHTGARNRLLEHLLSNQATLAHKAQELCEQENRSSEGLLGLEQGVIVTSCRR